VSSGDAKNQHNIIPYEKKSYQSQKKKERKKSGDLNSQCPILDVLHANEQHGLHDSCSLLDRK